MDQFSMVIVVLLLVGIHQVPVPASPVPSCACPARESHGYCPVPDDCQQYIHCDADNIPKLYNCSAGTIWNQKTLTCHVGHKKYGCSNSPIGFVCPNGNVGLYTDPSNCAGFIQCSRHIAYHVDCVTGTVWNRDLKMCTFGKC